MEFDGELVNALRDNGRLSVSELARRLNKPRRRVQERMRDLIDSGAMRIVANVHPAMLGIHIFCDVMLWVDGPTEGVTDALRGIPEATLVSAVAGHCDVVVELGAVDAAHLGVLLSRVRQIPGVRETASSQLLRIFRSRFQSGTELEQPTLPVLDAIDNQMIMLLREDGRMTFQKIGLRVGLSIGAVRSRLSRLLGTGMVRIACEVNRSDAARPIKMGAGIRLGGSDAQSVEALQEMLAVEFGATALGHFDMVLTVSAPSIRTLHAAAEKIRALPGINGVMTWVHLDLVRESYE